MTIIAPINCCRKQYKNLNKQRRRVSMNLPDFKTYEERDTYFRENADYFTVVKKTGVGIYDRFEFSSLDEALRAAQTKATIGGGGWMIYGVIDGQSAFVTSVPKSNTKKGKK
jgi:hypothetical protein